MKSIEELNLMYVVDSMVHDVTTLCCPPVSLSSLFATSESCSQPGHVMTDESLKKDKELFVFFDRFDF